MRGLRSLILKTLEYLVAPYSVLSRVLPQVMLLGVVVYVTTLVFVHYQHLDFLSGLYAATSLVTTIGLYSPEVTTMPGSEKAILTVIMVVSVATYTSVITGVISVITKRSVWIDARGRWRGRHMRDHVVVIGDSAEVLEATLKLGTMGEEYVVLTNSQELVPKLSRDKVIIGDPKNEADLTATGVREAKSALVIMSSDNDSLLVTLKLQKLKPSLRTVVEIRDDSLRDAFVTAGADIILSVRRMAGRILASAAVSGNMGGYMVDPTSEASSLREMSIGTYKVGEGSRLDGLKLGDLPKGVIPILIIRGAEMTPYFSRETEVRAGDTIVILGRPEDLAKVRFMVESRVQF